MLRFRIIRTLTIALGALSLTACASFPFTPSPQQKIERQQKMAAAARTAHTATFQAADASRQGVVTTASGLRYKALKSGPASGPLSRATDTVEVHYEGWLLTGQVFDSSYARNEPAAFPVNRLIPAWVEALQLMRPGDEWVIYAPSNLAYGPRGAGADIPPNADLMFRLEILSNKSQP
jgi:FKBP-type peptidyl-prolyl cis-trans isomerase